VSKTGSFGEDWTVVWSQSEALSEDTNGRPFYVENLYNAFGYKKDDSILISYITDPLIELPYLLSAIQVSYDNSDWIRLIDEDDFSAYTNIVQVQQTLEHFYFASGKTGTDIIIKFYVEGLLQNVPLTTRDLEAIFPLIEAVKAPDTRKALLLKYLDKVSSMSEVGLEPPISFIAPLESAEVTTNFGELGNSVFLRAPSVEAPVRAMQDGIVLGVSRLSWNDGYLVALEHANGYITVYTNLKSEGLPQKDQRVEQGDVIGYLGGGYMWPEDELKLYVRTPDESWVDPLQFLPELPNKLGSNRVYEHPYLMLPQTPVTLEATEPDIQIYVDSPSEEDKRLESLIENENARAIPFRFDPEEVGDASLLKQAYNIRVLVQDEQGERELLWRKVPAAQVTEATFKIYGEATMQLFINNVLFMTWNP
jgi:murein DD-endopeptidase MepM/ murein hydrolase activator NlpD